MSKKKNQNDDVILIDNPFQMKDLEISNAQNSTEELILDQDLDLNEGDEGITLDRLAQAMSDESERQEKEISEIVETSPEISPEETLALQIAEDEALQAQLAKEEQEAEEVDEELLAALPKAPQAGESGELDLNEMQSCIEALLFMVDKPMSAKKLQELLGEDLSLNLFQEALTALADRYQHVSHGIELVQINNGYQFRTKAGRAPLARKLAKIRTQRLSSGGMESLAIIAYKQPVMKEEIDKVRGVDSSYFIRGLLDKKLIKIVGRSELPGRPMMYGTTDEFLELFSLKDLSAMPSLREVENMIPTSQSANPDEEDPRVKEMRRLVGQMKSDSSTNLNYNPAEDETILQDIRDRVSAISVTTPYLEEQKRLEKLTVVAAKEGLSLEQYLERQKALEAAAAQPDVETQIPSEFT